MKTLQILHFNDVYHIQERKAEPVGGAARFAGALHKFRNEGLADGTLVMCSGDCFAPSIESSISRGKHWPPIYNEFGIDIACYGNHDLDFGLPQLTKLAGACNFPWLMSNVVNAENGQPICNGLEYWTCSKLGVNIGVIGIAEDEWLQTIPNLPEFVKFLPFVEKARELARMLKQTKQVDVVIALTHMRLPNDELLSANVPEIDLILGGHDHFYKNITNEQGQMRIIKSGSDFTDLSRIHLTIDDDGKVVETTCERVKITRDFAPHAPIAAKIVEITTQLNEKLSKVLCKSSVSLDTRTSTSRTEETNFGSFVADIMRIAYNTDVSILVGGTIRADRCYPPGPITMADVMDIFPYEDPIVVIEVTGDCIYRALENGVSKVPTEEGRFPQISGMHFTYDSSLPPMQRITSVHILRRDDHGQSKMQLSAPKLSGALEDYDVIDKTKRYSLATRAYIADGNDGFTMLQEADVKTIVGQEEGLMPSLLMRRFFRGLGALKAIISSGETIIDRKPGIELTAFEARKSYRNLLRKAIRSDSIGGENEGLSNKQHEKFIPEISPMTTARIVDISKK